jgi:hypothetical protein
MKPKTGFLIVALSLLAGGCDLGGGGGHVNGRDRTPVSGGAGSGGGETPPPGTGTGGGYTSDFATGLESCNAGDGGVGRIWVAGVQFGERERMRLLIAETGEFRWLPGDGWFQQVVGTFQVDGTNVSSTDAIWSWVDGLTYVETRSESVQIWGGIDAQGGLTLQYEFDSNPALTGSYSFTACDSVYRRESSLAILAGAYSNLYDDYSLAIDSQGVIFYQSARTGCVGNGFIELIDPDFNIYRATVRIENCTGQIENGPTYTGLGYLGDSRNDASNDTVEFALSTGAGSRVIMWNLVARR